MAKKKSTLVPMDGYIPANVQVPNNPTAPPNLYGNANNFDITLTSGSLNDNQSSTSSFTISNKIVVDDVFLTASVESNTGCDLLITFQIGKNVIFKAQYPQNIGTTQPDKRLFDYFIPIEKQTVIEAGDIFTCTCQTVINGAGNAIRVRGSFGLLGTITY